MGSTISTWSARSTSKPSPHGANAVPVLVPALGSEIDLPSLLDACDGLLLTGSASNVEPQHYGGPASEPGTLHDPNRDATTLPLIPRAVAAGLPVLAICRGFQEMNVAYGGTLNPRLHEVPGNLDHRDDESLPLDVQYAPAHEVLLEPGGQLQKIAGQDRLKVNSLHSQGVEKLGADLAVEARAPDGVIEAFRVADSPSFRVGAAMASGMAICDRIHFRARCLPHLVRPAANAQTLQGDVWRARFNNS